MLKEIIDENREALELLRDSCDPVGIVPDDKRIHRVIDISKYPYRKEDGYIFLFGHIEDEPTLRKFTLAIGKKLNCVVMFQSWNGKVTVIGTDGKEAPIKSLRIERNGKEVIGAYRGMGAAMLRKHLFYLLDTSETPLEEFV